MGNHTETICPVCGGDCPGNGCDNETFQKPVSPIVGKTFKARHGLNVKIIKQRNGWFYSDDGESYTPDGMGYHGSHFDLIEMIS